MRIIARETGLTMGQMRRGWAETTYKVGIDQDLLTLMEAEAQWMIRNHFTITREMPNYLDVFYLKGLEAVKPEAIAIIY